MPNALSGYSANPPAGQTDTAYWKWNPYTQQFEPTQAYQDLQQNGDPSLGTNVQYGLSGSTGLSGPAESFAPGQNPTLFLNAGSNYADTGGMKAAVPGTDLYRQLSADERTRNQQGILKVAALVGGGALAANSGWSNALPSSSGYGSGIATASDAAYGAAPAGSIGAEGVGATGAIGAGTAAGGGAGAGMGLGISDWLNLGTTVLGAAGANRAANTAAGASDAAVAEQRRQYDQTRTDLQPWLTAGQGALGQLQDPNANFQASPDYAFRRSEGQRDLGNSFAARGGAFSGNALKALDQYNSSLASGEFGNWWNRQANLAGVGQTAGSNLGQLGANSATNVGNALQNAGDARASGIQNSSAILAGGANNILSNYLYRQRQNPYGGYSPYQGYGG